MSDMWTACRLEQERKVLDGVTVVRNAINTCITEADRLIAIGKKTGCFKLKTWAQFARAEASKLLLCLGNNADTGIVDVDRLRDICENSGCFLLRNWDARAFTPDEYLDEYFEETPTTLAAQDEHPTLSAQEVLKARAKRFKVMSIARVVVAAIASIKEGLYYELNMDGITGVVDTAADPWIRLETALRDLEELRFWLTVFGTRNHEKNFSGESQFHSQSV